VTNFILSPILYRAGGVSLSIAIASAFGASGVFFCALSQYFQQRLLVVSATEEIELRQTQAYSAVNMDKSSSPLHVTEVLLTNIIRNIQPTEMHTVFTRISIFLYLQLENVDCENVEDEASNIGKISDESTVPDSHDPPIPLNSVEENIVIESDSGDICIFHRLTRQYYSYLLAGMCLYGSMVPFWFMGSKFLQIRDGISVGRADTLILLPGMCIQTLRASLNNYFMKFEITYDVYRGNDSICIATIGPLFRQKSD
jgi:hypothetical protein